MASTSAEIHRMPLLQARSLAVTVAGHPLLQSTDFDIGRGELVVLVGASGTGKTMLLKLIAGIARPGRRSLTVDGELSFDGSSLLEHRPEGGRIGILFQDHALFDELTALGNVRFAVDHRRRRDRTGQDPRQLLEELGIAPGSRPRTMSGGQLQRLALARTLALAPDLILHDEPTTGLDPANARRVADLILDTHRRTGCTSLVVTHDVALLLPMADRVLYLDPHEKTITEVTPQQARERLESPPPSPPGDATDPAPPPVPLAMRLLEATGEMVVRLLTALFHLVPLFPRWRYGAASLRHNLGLCASPGAFAYIGVAGVVLGYVATYFTFEHLPKRGFTEPLFQDDILRALGYLMYRVLTPVLVTLLIAARTGAAIASDIGNRVYSRQFDAMRSLGVHPARYLLTSALWALLISAPVLLMVSFLASLVFSVAVFIFGHPEHTYFFWEQNFMRSLEVPGEFLWRGTGWLLLKVELCAFGTAAIAYFQGAREKMAASDVSRAVTRTIILASLFVLAVHFGLAFLEF